MLNSRKTWFYLAGCLFCLEVFIAAFMHDRIVRPYVGDLLAVVFLYCFVQSWVAVPTKPTLLAVLLFAYGLEVAQYFHLAARLGLAHSSLALVVLGSHFEWIDLLAYTAGAGLVWAAEWGVGLARARPVRHV